jgi:hypothetical protein
MPNPDPEQATKPIDRLTGSYTPSPLPFDSPDGSSIGAPITSSALPEPLCRRGPCRHYHEIEVQVDEAEPLSGALEHRAVQTHASCYAHVGVETELSLDAPVVRCNLWSPLRLFERRAREKEIADFERDERLDQEAEAAEREGLGLATYRAEDETIPPEELSAIIDDTIANPALEGDATP